MTALEELRQARDALVSRVDNATPQPWRRAFPGGNRMSAFVDIWGGPPEATHSVHEDFERADADPIVAAVGLTPVVLAILDDAIEAYENTPVEVWASARLGVTRMDALILARAINGSTSIHSGSEEDHA